VIRKKKKENEALKLTVQGNKFKKRAVKYKMLPDVHTRRSPLDLETRQL
jgi:hypothetical protein